MIERYFRFAGIEFAAVVPEEMMYAEERRLAPFAVPAAEDPHIFRFRRVECMTPPKGNCIKQMPDFQVYEEPDQTVRYIALAGRSWDKAHIRVAHRGKDHDVQVQAKVYPGRISAKTVLESLAVEHLIVHNHGVVFHCSYIDRDGKAILFTAPSETGKSTQADLWNRYRGTQIINGDRAAIRVADGEILAEGIPFSGSSRYCENRSLPIEAIVYLAQAPRTTVRKLRGYEAFARIWEGCSINTWDKEDMELASDTVRQIAESVPVFYMPCTPDEDAVVTLEQALRKQADL